MKRRARAATLVLAIVALQPWTPTHAAALLCQVTPTQPVLGEAVHWRLRATDLAAPLPTWTAAEFAPDWLLHAQTTSSAADGKGHHSQDADVTLYPMRTGLLTLPSLKLGGQRCAPRPVSVVTHAPGGQPLYLSIHTSEAQPMVGAQMRVELDLDRAGGLSWEPIAAQAPDANLLALPSLDRDVEASGTGKTIPVQRHTWALLPLRAGELKVEFPTIRARRFGQLLIYPPESILLQVRPRPAFWPANLPIGRPRILLGPAPASLQVGQTGALHFTIHAPGIAPNELASVLEAQASQQGLKFYAPRIHPTTNADGESDGTLRVDWPYLAKHGGPTHYPELRIPYLDTQLGAPQRLQVSWGRVQVTDPRVRHLLMGLLGVTGLLAAFALMRWAYGAWSWRRRRIAWARLTQSQDVPAFIALWSQSRQPGPRPANPNHTLRAWHAIQCKAGLDGSRQSLRLLNLAEAQRYGRPRHDADGIPENSRVLITDARASACGVIDSAQ
jgi:hypothetical protein